VVDGFARQYKIPARAANGKSGAGAGAVPPQPVASPGQAGSVQVEPVTIDAVGKNFDLPFLRLVLAYADCDRASGEGGRAMERYRWLTGLVEPLAEQDPAAADIWRAADEALPLVSNVP